MGILLKTVAIFVDDLQRYDKEYFPLKCSYFILFRSFHLLKSQYLFTKSIKTTKIHESQPKLY